MQGILHYLAAYLAPGSVFTVLHALVHSGSCERALHQLAAA